jgi:serine/threonine protein kinase
VIGRQIAQYRIEAQIGEGGMGVVYRALDLTLDRPVALKLLPPDLARNADLRERFQAEAKAQANLNHPNIATVYGYIQDGDSAFIAMEYVEGETLEQRIRRAPFLPRKPSHCSSKPCRASDMPTAWELFIATSNRRI